jgi:hypothetical protein
MSSCFCVSRNAPLCGLYDVHTCQVNLLEPKKSGVQKSLDTFFILVTTNQPQKAEPHCTIAKMAVSATVRLFLHYSFWPYFSQKLLYQGLS